MELILIIRGFHERVEKAKKGEKAKSPIKGESTLLEMLKKLLGSGSL